MADSDTPTTENNGQGGQEEYVMTFRNGALNQLKQIAGRLGISEDNLEQVVEKGVKALELPDDNRLIYKKGEGNYFIDIRNL